MTKGVHSEKESYYFVVLRKYTNISKYGKDRQNSNHVKTHALRPLGIKTSGHVFFSLVVLEPITSGIYHLITGLVYRYLLFWHGETKVSSTKDAKIVDIGYEQS